MSRKNDRTVSQRDDGQWANKLNEAQRASSLHQTQADAYKAARQMSENQGGGEVTIQGRQGRFLNKNTVPPAKDPFPPRG